MANKKEFAIIVAGGSGTRMGSDLPKQFLDLGGEPILFRTIRAFHNYSTDVSIILALPEQWQEHWQSLVDRDQFEVSHQVVNGGQTRTESVINALAKVPNDVLVAIHDGVRPLVSRDMIANSFQIAEEYGTAVATMPVKETIRMIEGESSKTLPRDQLQTIQTPQTFKSELIKEAYAKIDSGEFTDDASVAEDAGVNIKLFPGSYRNIKITTAEDLATANALI